LFSIYVFQVVFNPAKLRKISGKSIYSGLRPLGRPFYNVFNYFYDKEGWMDYTGKIEGKIFGEMAGGMPNTWPVRRHWVTGWWWVSTPTLR